MSAVPKAATPGAHPSPFDSISLDDKYLLTHGRVYMTGTQALDVCR